MKIKVGDAAPAFALLDQQGTRRKLSDYAGKWLLIYFYPKDDTPGCTKEACAFRDNFPAFKKLNIDVLGISVDSVRSHDKFVNKYNLPFTLLSDEDKAVVELYGVWGQKKFMGRSFLGTHRMSFLVEPRGKVAKVYEKVKPEEHAEEVLNDLKILTGQAKK